MRSAGVRTLVIALGGAGLLFGATEVAVTAAAEQLGGTAAAGPLLGLWGVGSLIGGIAVARAGGGARTGAGLAALLGLLAVSHLALAAAAGSILALGAVIVLAGSMIAPTCASAYAMVDAAAPAGTTTEAFAWLATAIAIGTSAGAALAGVVADASGPAPTFALAGAAGLAGALACVLRAGTVTSPTLATAAARVPRLYTIGYERLLPPELDELAGVERLLDVRHRPQSRRPGMSKTRLGQLLSDHGSPTSTARSSAPRPTSAGYFKNKREAEGRERYRTHVEETASDALDALAAELDHAPATALLCLEATPEGCHRRVIAEQLTSRRADLEVVDL